MGMCCCIEAPPLSASPLVDYEAEPTQPVPVTPLRQLEQQRHDPGMGWQLGLRERAAYAVNQFQQPSQASFLFQSSPLSVDTDVTTTESWLHQPANLVPPATQLHDPQVERLAGEFGQFDATNDLFGQPCPICQDELQIRYVTIGLCKHAMHWNCLKELLSHAEDMPIKCPNCRRDYEPQNNNSES